MLIGSRQFDTANEVYIMGILNVTPDSFSDGGKYVQTDRALFRAEEMIKEGADIIDVGGESTRPGYAAVSSDEEIGRVVPVIEAIRREFDIPISLDTYKADVAEAGLLAGAHMINDIWGLKYDERMAGVIAGAGAACCLMHNRRAEETSGKAVYTDFCGDVLSDLEESVELAVKAGIHPDKIMLDPGIGFAKTYEQNMWLMGNLEKLHALGLPLMLAASRKSVIGLTLHLPKEERMEGTLATSVTGVMKGCSFLRVHDIKENVRAVKMALAIRKESE